jgi:hypothetical protein
MAVKRKQVNNFIFVVVVVDSNLLFWLINSKWNYK